LKSESGFARIFDTEGRKKDHKDELVFRWLDYNSDRETLKVISNRNGASLTKDSEDGCWRLYLFVENTVTYESVETPLRI